MLIREKQARPYHLDFARDDTEDQSPEGVMPGNFENIASGQNIMG